MEVHEEPIKDTVEMKEMGDHKTMFPTPLNVGQLNIFIEQKQLEIDCKKKEIENARIEFQKNIHRERLGLLKIGDYILYSEYVRNHFNSDTKTYAGRIEKTIGKIEKIDILAFGVQLTIDGYDENAMDAPLHLDLVLMHRTKYCKVTLYEPWATKWELVILQPDQYKSIIQILIKNN
jgi:hypothetical protein